MRGSLDLTAYVRQTVRLGLYFYSHNSPYCSGTSVDVAPGWYVDDMMIQVGSIGLGEVGEKVVNEHEPLSFQVVPVGGDGGSSLGFSLPWAPPGAWIDPETGVFSWLPGERQGPGVYHIPVQVVDYGHGDANEMITVKVTVNEVNERPWLMPAVVAVEPGQTVRLPLLGGDRDLPRNPLRFTMAGVPAGATLTTNTGVFEWAVPLSSPAAVYRGTVTLADHGSPNYTTNNSLTIVVTPNAEYWLEVRVLSEQEYEFTIHDRDATEDYILQQTDGLRGGLRWVPNGEAMPRWVPTVPAEDDLVDAPWDTFVSRRLEATVWEDVLRVSPSAMPFRFVHRAAGEPHQVFRAARVKR